MFSFLSEEKCTLSDTSQNVAVLSPVYADMNCTTAFCVPSWAGRMGNFSTDRSVFFLCIKNWFVFLTGLFGAWYLYCKLMFSWQYGIWISFINITLPTPYPKARGGVHKFSSGYPWCCVLGSVADQKGMMKTWTGQGWIILKRVGVLGLVGLCTALISFLF